MHIYDNNTCFMIGSTILTGMVNPLVALLGHLLPRRPHPRAVEITGEPTLALLKERNTINSLI